jgi:hypothetical protein
MAGVHDVMSLLMFTAIPLAAAAPVPGQHSFLSLSTCWCVGPRVPVE